jgi:hypothetical protein
VRRGAFKMQGSGRAFGSKEQGKGKGSQRCLPDSGGRGNTQGSQIQPMGKHVIQTLPP